MTRFIPSVLFTLSLLILAACNQLDSPQPATTPDPATPRLEAQATCATSGSTVTCTYSSSSTEQSFTVPAGVTSVTVVARGAPGGTGSDSGPGGRGAVVSAELSVTPGQTLYLNVGGAPTGSGTNACYPNTVCIGGYNGGGTSRFGGGGGGASDVRTVSGDLASRVLVAAGGGGGGGNFFCVRPVNAGGGGDAGSPGGTGEGCYETNGGTGGGAGTGSAGGAGGSPDGQPGSLGQGGNGGSNQGGGGGGGLYGGGGGGDLVSVSGPGGSFELTAAGGGGGGSSLDPDGGTITLDDTRTSQITLSYTLPDTTGPSVTVNQAEGQADPTTTSPVSFTASFSEPIREGTLAFDDFNVSGTANATITVIAEITRGSVYRLSLVPANPGTTIVSLPAGKVTDLVGNPNSASTSTDNTVTFVVADTTNPEIALTTPTDSATYKLKQRVNAAYSCSDEGSGVASCTGTVANGSPIDTASVGQKSFTVTARDNAGNETSKTVSYKVIYDFKGFFFPVKNAPALNSYKAGLPVPFTFTLGGNYGRSVLSSVKSVAISCKTLQPLGSSSSESTNLATQAGSRSLSAQSKTTIYLYLWKTQRTWKGTCREFTLTLNDATEHRANFKFN